MRGDTSRDIHMFSFSCKAYMEGSVYYLAKHMWVPSSVTWSFPTNWCWQEFPNPLDSSEDIKCRWSSLWHIANTLSGALAQLCLCTLLFCAQIVFINLYRYCSTKSTLAVHIQVCNCAQIYQHADLCYRVVHMGQYFRYFECVSLVWILDTTHLFTLRGGGENSNKPGW